MKELICIVCPRGCRLQIHPEQNNLVTGNHCDKGIEYAKTEFTAPVRTVTSTVKILGAAYPRLPVKTNHPIPKECIDDVMKTLNTVCVTAPVHVGDIIVKNIVDSGADLVATRTM